jgi:hypothetical protein
MRQRIQQLQRYRHLGIKTLASTKLYGSYSLVVRNTKQWKQFSASLHVAFPVQHQHQQFVTSALLQGSNGNNVLVAPSGHFPQQKRSVQPLDIVGLPGYNKSNEGEQQLSSVSRLVPESYLEFRNILITECHNRKRIRLAQTRTLIKIDVNKTRKIFNFLLEEKLIYFPS